MSNYPYTIGLGSSPATIASAGTNAATATAVTNTPSIVDTSAGGGVILPAMVAGICMDNGHPNSTAATTSNFYQHSND